MRVSHKEHILQDPAFLLLLLLFLRLWIPVQYIQIGPCVIPLIQMVGLVRGYCLLVVRGIWNNVTAVPLSLLALQVIYQICQVASSETSNNLLRQWSLYAKQRHGLCKGLKIFITF